MYPCVPPIIWEDMARLSQAVRELEERLNTGGCRRVQCGPEQRGCERGAGLGDRREHSGSRFEGVISKSLKAHELKGLFAC